LLHYAELFIEESPANFNPFRINKFDHFVSALFFINVVPHDLLIGFHLRTGSNFLGVLEYEDLLLSGYNGFQFFSFPLVWSSSPFMNHEFHTANMLALLASEGTRASEAL